MSKISSILDRVRAIVKSRYFAKLELIDVDDLSNNPEYILKNGYDVEIGANSIDSQMKNAGYVNDRVISLILTKSIIEADNRNDNRQSKEKTLLDESIEIAKDIKTDSDLVGLCLNIDFAGDNGIDFFSSGEAKFMSLVMNFDVKYLEFY